MKKISFVLAALFAIAACSKSNVVERDSLVSIPVTVESIVIMCFRDIVSGTEDIVFRKSRRWFSNYHRKNYR